MDAKKLVPVFMILEEDIAEEDENIATEWYLDFSFTIITKKECSNWIFM